MTTIVVVDEAEQQLREIDEWWRVNRREASRFWSAHHVISLRSDGEHDDVFRRRRTRKKTTNAPQQRAVNGVVMLTEPNNDFANRRLVARELRRASSLVVDLRHTVGLPMMVPAVKEVDAQTPVASTWRPAFVGIVDAFVRGDYALSNGVPSVAAVSPETAARIRGYIEEYGETLCALPEESWETSVAMWDGRRWEVLVDLWTVEAGASDLVLHVFVSEVDGAHKIDVHHVYVP